MGIQKEKIYSKLLILLSLLSFIACETQEYKIEDNATQVENSETKLDSEVVFDGLNSVSDIDDYSAKMNWTSTDGINLYYVWDISDGGKILKATVTAPASSYTVLGLSSSQSYLYKVTAQDEDGREINNDSEIVFTTNAQPDAPIIILQTIPSHAIDVDPNPSFLIYPVRRGDILNLYSDTCTTQVGTLTVDNDSGYMTISATTDLAVGTYSFHVDVESPNGVSSNCSTASATYQYRLCPSGYIEVPADGTLSTKTFCVMAYEAKAWSDADSDGIVDSTEVDSDGCNESGCTTKNWGTNTYSPGSGEDGHPWRMLDQETAKAQCRALGDNYDLIANDEWMAIARNIEDQAANWSSLEIGVGCVNQGNTGISASCSYDGGGIESGSGRSAQASHTLSNAEVIYDFSGNVFEWIDMGKDEQVITFAPNTCEEKWYPIESADDFCSDELEASDFLSENPGGLTFTTYENTYDLSVDSDGDLYIGTDGGLAYSNDDASNFTNFTTVNGIPKNQITGGIATGASGVVFVGTVDGLGFSNDGGETFSILTTAEGLGSDNINDVYIDTTDNVYGVDSDEDGNIYVANDGGLSISTDSGASFTNYDMNNGIAQKEVSGGVRVDKNGDIYVGTTAGLGISTDGGTTFTNKTTANGLGSDTINHIFIDRSDFVYGVAFDSSGFLYVANDDGLAFSNDSGTTYTNYSTGNGIPDKIVNGGVVLDNNDDIYVGTESGLSISVDGGTTFATKTNADGLGSDIVNRIFIDTDDNVYALNIDVNGLLYIANDGGLSSSNDNATTFTNFTQANGLTSKEITGGVSTDSAGNILVGTNTGIGLSADAGVTFAMFTTVEGLASNTVKDVKFDASDDIYIATDNGLDITDDGGATFTNRTTVEGLGSNDILCLYFNSDGDLYACTTGGISVSTDDGATFTNSAMASGNGMPSDRIQDVYEDSNGNIYLATDKGLAISTDAGVSYRVYDSSNGMGSDDINSVFVDTAFNIYIGTENGISYSTDGGVSFTNVTIEDGLNSNKINDMIVDASLNLYLATDRGICLTADLANFTCRNSSDGLGDVNNIWVATSGGLSFSTDGGVTFTNRTTVEGLGNNLVLDSYVDDNVVIAATLGGLSISEDFGATFTNYDTTSGINIPNDVITRVKRDRYDRLYIGTEDGFAYSDTLGGNFEDFETANGLVSDNIQDFAISESGTVVLATPEGVNYTTSLDKNTVFETLTLSGNFVGKTVDNVTFEKDSYFYLGTPHGVCLTDLATISCQDSADGIGDNNNIFISTAAGLTYSLDSGVTFTNVTTLNGLGSNTVLSSYVSEDGVIWVGTSNGVSVSTDRGANFTNYNSLSGIGLVGNDIRSVALDYDNKIYLATDAGLAISTDDGTSFTNYTTADGLISDSLNSVTAEGFDNIYVGSDKGISFSFDNAVTFTSLDNEDGLNDNNVTDLLLHTDGLYIATEEGLCISSALSAVDDCFEASDGLGGDNNIYVATTAGLSISTDGGASFTTATTANGLGNDLTLSVDVKDNGDIIVGTISGISTSSDGGTTFANLNNVSGVGLVGNRMQVVYEDEDGNVYAGSNLGLAISTNGGITFTNYDTSNGLLSNDINDVFVDAEGDIYIATEVGLGISDDGGTTINMRTTSNGLADNSVESVLRGSDNKIYIATEKGLCSSSDSDTFTCKDSTDGLGGEVMTGLGQIMGGIGKAAYRGGSYKFGEYAGIFTLSFSSYGDQSYEDGGFRCVYRPD